MSRHCEERSNPENTIMINWIIETGGRFFILKVGFMRAKGVIGWLNFISVFFNSHYLNGGYKNQETWRLRGAMCYFFEKKCSEEWIHIRLEVENLINRISYQRYRFVLRKLILEDMETQKVANEMNISINNLYNIKHRVWKKLARFIGTEKEV